MRRDKFKKILAWTLCAANILSFSMPTMAAEGNVLVAEEAVAVNETTVSNIALEATVTASAQYGSMPASYAEEWYV